MDPMPIEVSDDQLRHDMAHDTVAIRKVVADDVIDVFSLRYVEEQWPLSEENTRKKVVFTPETVCLVLNQLARTGVLWRACVTAAITPAHVNRMRRDFPIFDELIEQALSVYRDRLQEAIHERAINGVPEPQFYQGEVCGHITRYSDKLLELHAKRHIPEYRDHTTTDITVKAGVLAIAAPTVTREEYLAARRKADSVEGKIVDGNQEPTQHSDDGSTGTGTGNQPAPNPEQPK